MFRTRQITIVLNAQPIPFTSEIETITECIIYFKYVEIRLTKYIITARYDLYHEHQPRLTWNVHLIWPMELSNLTDFLERFGNIAVINDEVLSNYGFFHSPAIFNNLDETSNSILSPAFYELYEEIKKNNVKLLDEDDFIINQKVSDSRMLKLKLDMQLFTVTSTTIFETNSDSILYGMLIILLSFTLLYFSIYLCIRATMFASFVVIS